MRRVRMAPPGGGRQTEILKKKTLRWGLECAHILHRRRHEVNDRSIDACAKLHDSSAELSSSARNDIAAFAWMVHAYTASGAVWPSR